MKLVQVENGQIIKWQLPKVGQLKDGRTVSGYHLLDEETLREEGWLPLEDIQPGYDTETEYLVSDGFQILADKIVKLYRVETIIIPEEVIPELTEVEILNGKLQAMLDIADFHEELIVELATEVYK